MEPNREDKPEEKYHDLRVTLPQPIYRHLCIIAAQSEPIKKAHKLAAEILVNQLSKMRS